MTNIYSGKNELGELKEQFQKLFGRLSSLVGYIDAKFFIGDHYINISTSAKKTLLLLGVIQNHLLERLIIIDLCTIFVSNRSQVNFASLIKKISDEEKRATCQDKWDTICNTIDLEKIKDVRDKELVHIDNDRSNYDPINYEILRQMSCNAYDLLKEIYEIFFNERYDFEPEFSQLKKSLEDFFDYLCLK